MREGGVFLFSEKKSVMRPVYCNFFGQELGVMRRFTLRTRLILATSLILVFSFGLISSLNYRVSRQLVRENLVEQVLPLTRDHLFSVIEGDLVRPVMVASLMAESPLFRDWLAAGEKDPETVRKRLLEIRNRNDFFSTFLISDATGDYHHFNGKLKTVSQSLPEDAWYFDFCSKDVDYALGVGNNKAADGDLTIFINHRIVDAAGGLLGVTGVGISVDRLARVFHSFQDQYGCHVFLVNRQGIVQVHSDVEKVTRCDIRKRSGFTEVADQFLGNETTRGVYSYRNGRQHMLVSVRYVPELDWFLVVEYDENKAISGIRSHYFRNLVAGFLITVCILGMNFFTVNHFQRRLEKHAVTDALTGTCNRRAFQRHFATFVYRQRREEKAFCLLLMDVDGFKGVNDREGHLVGDQILRGVARRITGEIRLTDPLARWGGDEFTVLAEGCLEDVMGVAERIRERIAGTGLGIGKKGSLLVSVSCGVAAYRPGDSLDDLMNRADIALYEAKAAGRNQVAAERVTDVV